MRKSLIALVAAVGTAVCSCTGSTTAPTTPTAAVHRQVSQLQTDVNALQALGAVSAVAHAVNGGTPTDAVAGVTVLGGHAAPAVNTHYRTGSVTKTFVATVVLQLVGEGRMTLDDTVDRWLPGLITQNGNDGTKITVRELLQHTSGLPDYLSVPAFVSTRNTAKHFYANSTHQYAPIDLVNLAQSQHPLFSPGTSWSYSSTNYIVAGMIIQAVTGNNWAVEVNNRIIGPFGLTGTSIPAAGVLTLPAPFADGYNLWSSNDNNRVYSDTTQDDMTWADAAGAMTTTTADETAFFTALLGGRLLASGQLAQMKTLVPADPNTGYGLGIAHMTLCGKDIWWHNGGVVGYAAWTGTTADTQIALAVDIATTSFDGSDSTFNNAVTNQENLLIQHAFCGTG